MKKFHPLSPLDLKNSWPMVRWALLRAVPPSAGGGTDTMQRILVRILTGKAQAWLFYDETTVYTTILTYVDSDALTGKKYVVLYALYNYVPIEDDDWKMMLQSLEDFALESGAERILAFTQVPRIVEVATSLGFEGRFTLLSKEINENG